MTKRNIHQRLHAVMGEVDYVQKERKPGMRYTIVSHDAVTAKVRPVLVSHGIVYYPVSLTRRQDGNRTEVDLTVRFANIDEPTDYIDVVSAGYGVDEQDKGPGKAISYAVKYALLKALGLETGDDPDETQDDRATHRPAPAEQPRTTELSRLAMLRDQIAACKTLPEVDAWWAANYTEIEKLPDTSQKAIFKAAKDRKAELRSSNNDAVPVERMP